MINRLIQNWPAKLISVFFALILWFFVTGEQTAEVGFSIPLELKNIPKSMMVVNDVPSLVDVRINGPRTILSRLRPSDIQLSVDLKGAKKGVTTFRRLEERINIPTALKITRLSPSALDVRLEEIREKSVPIKVAFSGTPDKGFRLGKVEAIPAEVVVQGMIGELKKIREVLTIPVNIQDIREDISVSVSLDFNGKYTSLKETRDVEVRVTLKKDSDLNLNP
jgi:YbbR domain-containing protein